MRVAGGGVVRDGFDLGGVGAVGAGHEVRLVGDAGTRPVVGATDGPMVSGGAAVGPAGASRPHLLGVGRRVEVGRVEGDTEAGSDDAVNGQQETDDLGAEWLVVVVGDAAGVAQRPAGVGEGGDEGGVVVGAACTR